jgi:hypothetical protein
MSNTTEQLQLLLRNMSIQEIYDTYYNIDSFNPAEGAYADHKGIYYKVYHLQGLPHCSSHVGSYEVDDEWLKNRRHIWVKQGDDIGDDTEEEEEEDHKEVHGNDKGDDDRYNILSQQLMELILKTDIKKIVKIFVKIGYKGKIHTNKFLLGQQLLQNFNKVDELVQLILDITLWSSHLK